MSKYSKGLVLGSLLAVVPGVSVAQEWDGLYGGLTMAYTAHDVDHVFSNGAPSGSPDPDGALYGGFLGIAVQNGQTVIGAEFGFEGSNASGTFDDTTGLGSSGSAELDWQTSFRGVVGYAGSLGGKPALFYGTLGWALGDFRFEGGPAGGGFAGNGYSDTLDGWLIGLGVDAALGDNFSLRTEYTYTDYGSTSGPLAPAFPGISIRNSVAQHAFRVGIRRSF